MWYELEYRSPPMLPKFLFFFFSFWLMIRRPSEQQKRRFFWLPWSGLGVVYCSQTRLDWSYQANSWRPPPPYVQWLCTKWSEKGPRRRRRRRRRSSPAGWTVILQQKEEEKQSTLLLLLLLKKMGGIRYWSRGETQEQRTYGCTFFFYLCLCLCAIEGEYPLVVD